MAAEAENEQTRKASEAEHVQRRRRQQTVATRAALDTKIQLRELAATLRVQAAARGRLARRAASLGRHEAAEALHAARVAVRERLRLRGAVLSLQRAARAFSARRRLAEGRAAVAEMQLGAAYREEALLVQLRHVERSRSTIHLHRRRVCGRSGRGGRNTHPPTHLPTHSPLAACCTYPPTHSP